MTPHKKHAPKNIILSRRLVCLLALLAVFLCAILAFRGAGRWLVREDALRKADAIVVLSGTIPYRAEEGAHVYRTGYAPEVWLTRSESPAGRLAAMGIHYVGNEDYNRDVLVHGGVPVGEVRVLPGVIENTEQELEVVARALRREGKSSVIIVTSPEHTRRVKTLWRKRIGENPKAIVRAAPEDPFDPDHWWRNTRDALSVAREILGLMNAWAGLPVRPHSP